MRAVSLVTLGPCYGVDASQKLKAADAQRLAAATIQGQPVRFVWRYVFFGLALPGDIDAPEAGYVQDAGLVLLLVQHPRNRGWMASAARGAEDGKWAGLNAHKAGYEPGAYIALDLEGLGNAGQVVADHAEAWAQEVLAAGFKAACYVGYDCGLSPAQLYALHGIDRYWSDAGNRHVDVRGVCCVQGLQTQLAGVTVDPDQHFPDKLGGVLRGMARIPDAAPTTPEPVASTEFGDGEEAT